VSWSRYLQLGSDGEHLVAEAVVVGLHEHVVLDLGLFLRRLGLGFLGMWLGGRHVFQDWCNDLFEFFLGAKDGFVLWFEFLSVLLAGVGQRRRVVDGEVGARSRYFVAEWVVMVSGLGFEDGGGTYLFGELL
jgi:hypothetical protein